MSLREGPLGEIKPPRVWLAGAALVAAFLGAAVLFVALGPGSAGAGLARAADRASGTAGGVLSAPLRWAGQGAGAVGAYFLAGSQNQALREQLAAAAKWKDEAEALRLENARLRALLGLRTEPPVPMVSADTVLDARGPFSNSRLADIGAEAGVSEGNPALSEHGMVGRVAGVGHGVSRIMLLTDVESRMPVMIVRTNGRAILSGDGGPNPTLAYLRTHDALRQGDRVMTSGDGGVAPRGLPVGSAVKGPDGVWRVALDSDTAPIDFVRILLFKDFAQVAGPQALAPGPPPSTRTQPPPAPEPAAAEAAPTPPAPAPKP